MSNLDKAKAEVGNLLNSKNDWENIDNKWSELYSIEITIDGKLYKIWISEDTIDMTHDKKSIIWCEIFDYADFGFMLSDFLSKLDEFMSKK